MVRQTGRKNGDIRRGGDIRRKRSATVGDSSLKAEKEFSTSAKRALALRRFWLFVLTSVLLTVGILSVCGVKFF